MESVDKGVKDPSRRRLFGKVVKTVASVVLPVAFLEACAKSDRDLIVGIDTSGPFSTSDGKQITLDFGEIKARAEELMVTVAGSDKLPISPEDAVPYPKIVVKDGKPYLATDGKVGQVTDLVLPEIEISEEIKKLNKAGKVETIGLYPTPWGGIPGTKGRTEIVIKGNNEKYYGLRVIMPLDEWITETKKVPDWASITVGQKDSKAGMNGGLLCTEEGKVLGFFNDSRVFDKVK